MLTMRRTDCVRISIQNVRIASPARNPSALRVPAMPWIGPPGCQVARHAEERQRCVDQDAGDDLDDDRREQEAAQRVAERPHHLDEVARQGDERPEEGEDERVEDPADAGPGVLAPEHAERHPADEREQRHRQDAAPLDLAPPGRERHGRRDHDDRERRDDARPAHHHPEERRRERQAEDDDGQRLPEGRRRDHVEHDSEDRARRGRGLAHAGVAMPGRCWF